MRTKRGNGEGSVYKRSGSWWISYYDENGVRRRRSTRLTDRRLAERQLQAELDRLEQIRAGVLDPAKEQLAQNGERSLEELAAVYGDKLRAEACSEPYVKRTVREIEEFAAAAKITRLREVSSEKATAYLESLLAAGASARTRQCRITSVKSLTRWAWREGLIAADPLAGVKRPSEQSDRRLRRRHLSPEEWAWLEPTTASGDERFGFSGEERALLYATALLTGLRANELAQLTKSSLHLSSDKPFVVVEAGGTKNRKMARQYVKPSLAQRLSAHAARLTPGARVFKISRSTRLAEMLRDDMAAARTAWIEAAGDPGEAARRRESDFLLPKDAEGAFDRLPRSATHHGRLGRDGRSQPEGDPDAHASLPDHVDAGHLRPSAPRRIRGDDRQYAGLRCARNRGRHGHRRCDYV